MNDSRWMEKKITFEKTHLKSRSELEEMSDSRWTEKITFEKTHLKSGTGIRKMNGSRWMGKMTFVFGSDKNRRSVAREREKEVD